ncbi:MAG: endolytic transglycosylase MltG [Bacillota bacterium]|nr:endolytic transglycosylase MltG [Bacillota bacterium]
MSFLALHRLNSLIAPVSTTMDSQVIEVNIPLRSSTAQIAAILKDEGLIKNEMVFRLYSRYKGYDQKLQAGRHLLSPDMGLEELLTNLQQGVVYKEGIRFTIPEGFNLKQIAARLENEGLFEQEAFLQACLDYPRENTFDFLNKVPSDVYYTLEGYLFPDTFEVRRDITPKETIEIMLRRFDNVFTENFRNRAEELGLSIHEVVTLASIVEKESRVGDERPIIAAVFHNRLRSPSMPLLQSCATVQYVLGEVKPVLTYQDLEVDSSYNTYLYPNLPPGPIASPGREALEAVLYPADVNYLYFVYKEDGSGTHYFSTTLQEHNHYKNLAQRNR